MHPALFRRLLELKLITSGMAVEAHYEKENEKGKLIKAKGDFKIKRFYTHPFAFHTIVELENAENEIVETDYQGIKKIEGVDPSALGLQHGIRADGMNNDAPKRRGRKPKVRPEADFVEDDETDDAEYEDDDEVVEVE
jgi:hypothetical protein